MLVTVSHVKTIRLANQIQMTQRISLVAAVSETLTVKPDLGEHSKIDKTKILTTNGSLMKVEIIAECWSILQYF